MATCRCITPGSLETNQGTSNIRAEMYGKGQSVDGHRPSHLPRRFRAFRHQVLTQTWPVASERKPATRSDSLTVAPEHLGAPHDRKRDHPPSHRLPTQSLPATLARPRPGHPTHAPGHAAPSRRCKPGPTLGPEGCRAVPRCDHQRHHGSYARHAPRRGTRAATPCRAGQGRRRQLSMRTRRRTRVGQSRRQAVAQPQYGFATSRPDARPSRCCHPRARWASWPGSCRLRLTLCGGGHPTTGCGNGLTRGLQQFRPVSSDGCHGVALGIQRGTFAL